MISITSHNKVGSAVEQIQHMLAGKTAGTKLPSERELCERTGVSRMTIRKALDMLISMGTLRREPNAGVYLVTDLKSLHQQVCLLFGAEIASSAFGSSILQEFELAVMQRHWNFNLCPKTGHMQHIDQLQRADGIILMTDVDPAILPPATPVVIPFLTSYILPGASYVLIDDLLGGTTAGQYLLEMGHRHIAMVMNNHDWAQDRYRGLCRALQLADLPTPTCVNTHFQPITPQLLMPIIEHGDTAIVCANDETAISVISTLHKMGTHVPEDVSVISYDDIPMAASFAPPLTTIKIPTETIVTLTLDELALRMQQPESSIPKRIMAPMELVVRESCGHVFETVCP